jgi:hypothetical protein
LPLCTFADATYFGSDFLKQSAVYDPDSQSGVSKRIFESDNETLVSVQRPTSPLSEFRQKHGHSTSSLARLQGYLNDHGVLVKSAFPALSPAPQKSRLIFLELNPSTAPEFCLAAGNTVAENITFSCFSNGNSPFLGPRLCDALNSISRLSLRGDLEAGISLALLVHASKCADRVQFLKFHSLALCAEHLRIVEPVSKDTFEFASEHLSKDPLKSILLQNTSGMEGVLPKIQARFVELDDHDVRGWCAPRMAVFNRTATRNTPLELPAPFLGLYGHELKHVVVRESNETDLNFSTPDKPELTSSCSALQLSNRESGLWFELTAIGEKYDFVRMKDHVDMAALVTAMHQGIEAGCSPVLSAEQRARFYHLGAPYNSELPFECADLCPCYFTG